MDSPQLGELCAPSLRAGYLHELFRVVCSPPFIYLSNICLYQYGFLHILFYRLSCINTTLPLK